MSIKIKPKNHSYSEIISEVQYFEDITNLQVIMAIHRQSGACFAKVHYNKGDGIQENFVSGFLTAFSSFEKVVSEQLGTTPDIETIKAIQYGDFTITIFDQAHLRISLISSEPIRKKMREKCKILTKNYEKNQKIYLENFSGSMDLFLDFPKFVRKELDVKLNYKSQVNKGILDKYECPKNVKKVLETMAKLDEMFYPKDLPYVLMREADLNETMAKYYAYNAFLWYVFEALKEEYK